MTKATIYALDNDKPGNKEIVTFLKQNIQSLVGSGMRFSFTIADNIKNDLVARGITKLPAMEVHTPQGVKCFLTAVEIKSALLKYMQKVGASNGGGTGGNSNTATGGYTARRAKNPEDEMRSFYEGEMNLDKYDEDEGDADDGHQKDDITKRVQAEVERRQSEMDRRGPPKPRRGRRPGNVGEDRKRPARQDDDDEPAREPARREPARAAGGDPNNKDDAMLMAMMETSDEI